MRLPSKAQIAKRLKRKYSDASGCFGHFYFLTKKVGMKAYYSYQYAMKTYRLHKHLTSMESTKKHVPEIYGKVEKFLDHEGDAVWGYLVEVVDTSCNAIEMVKYKMKEISDKLKRVAVRKFKSISRWIRGVFNDNHNGNYGGRPVGKALEFVWIDFSR
jgi:hypothetical protein